MPRGQNHLVSIVHGPDNFAMCDLARGFTFACLTDDVARNRAYVLYHFLEPAVYLMIGGAVFFGTGLGLSLYRDRLLTLPDRLKRREGVFRVLTWR